MIRYGDTGDNDRCNHILEAEKAGSGSVKQVATLEWLNDRLSGIAYVDQANTWSEPQKFKTINASSVNPIVYTGRPTQNVWCKIFACRTGVVHVLKIEVLDTQGRALTVSSAMSSAVTYANVLATSYPEGFQNLVRVGVVYNNGECSIWVRKNMSLSIHVRLEVAYDTNTPATVIYAPVSPVVYADDDTYNAFSKHSEAPATS